MYNESSGNRSDLMCSQEVAPAQPSETAMDQTGRRD